MIKRKNFFVISSFLSGFCMMAMELSATRITAPFIGISIYSWTSIIGVILSGMAVGNYFGGRLIDKHRTLHTLAIFFCINSVLISSIPFFVRYLPDIVFLKMSVLVRILFSSFILFFPTSIAFGSLYPSILKLYHEKEGSLGIQAGTLSAMWAIGSIAGTFLTGFYFIAKLGSANTFFAISLIMLLPILFLCLEKAQLRANLRFLLLALAIIALFYCLAAQKSNNNLVFETESNYYKIQIADGLWNNISTRILFLDFDSHSIEKKDKNTSDMEEYTDIYPLFSALKDNVNDILVIGGGSYSIAKNFSDFYKNSSVTVVEVDPEVTRAAENFFELKRYPIKTANEDARMFLGSAYKKYDVIFGDAYNSFISLPWHLTTFEFNELAKKHLTKEGIYAVNFISAIEGENALFFNSMLKTFKKSFDNFYVFAYGATKKIPQSIVLVGLNSDNKTNIPKLTARLQNIKNGAFLSGKIIPGFFLEEKKGDIILTDNFAPIEEMMRPLINNYFNLYSRFYYFSVAKKT